MEPLSMKLCVRELDLYVVVSAPMLSTMNTLALPIMLLPWVPMPKIRKPLTEAAVPLTEPTWMMTPLLSVVNEATGVPTCMAKGMAVSIQVFALLQVK